ncbi:hypothetical protein BDQ12DRAFT_113539 [Crucibulum laeve]|uniref:Phosphatidic acid phosphatase type 2/haloperoxidase domain-containing protein n=1 Tax=Crucibulum laeve TaxID=68775 RepID=A0A5C3LZ34_9AGAR|nr:hypothetical protein BDQ12DRAFT_113539 [Crucibulum laeve]
MTLIRPRNGFVQTLNTIFAALVSAVGRLDKSFSPSLTIQRLQSHTFTASDSIYIFHIILATFWLSIMQVPSFPAKLIIPLLYGIALLIPFTSQFFIPATPVFAWLITYYTCQFIPASWRPSIRVSLLPTLESVLYGANISDILTRFTHPILDILAWLPYGVIHFIFPFVVAVFLWLFRCKEALHLWARVIGYMNLLGVIIQLIFPCSPPWYELIHGLTPANYSMKGSPGGLARIDALFGGHGYTSTFSNSPLVFGAFPSLHAGWATIEALFLSHFFPQTTKYIWTYVGVLYWATMYLTHHYLIDVVGGACLAIAFFYLFLPDELKGAGALAPPGSVNGYSRLGSGGRGWLKYDTYDLETPRTKTIYDPDDFDASSDEGEVDITYRSPAPANVTFGANSSGHTSTSTFTPSNVPSVGPVPSGGRRDGRSHKHTASIASLIHGDARGPADGWSPVSGAFVLPPQQSGKERSRE